MNKNAIEPERSGDSRKATLTRWDDLAPKALNRFKQRIREPERSGDRQPGGLPRQG